MASPDAHARLIVPRVSLASCVRAYITRSTVGVELSPQQRYNHFPATPTCTVCWFMQGSAWRPGASQPLPGPILFGGPHTGPSVSYNPGPVHGFMLIVMPDALRLMTGIDAGEYVNRVCAAQEVFDAEWQAMFDRVLHAPDDAARVRCIEEFLDPRWQAARGGGRWGSAGRRGRLCRPVAPVPRVAPRHRLQPGGTLAPIAGGRAFLGLPGVALAL